MKQSRKVVVSDQMLFFFASFHCHKINDTRLETSLGTNKFIYIFVFDVDTLFHV